MAVAPSTLPTERLRSPALHVDLRVNGRRVTVPLAADPGAPIGALTAAVDVLDGCGGVQAEADPAHSLAQVQLIDVAEPARAAREVEAHAADILGAASAALAAQGLGVAVELEARAFGRPFPMVVVHLLVEAERDGARASRVAARAVTALVEACSGGRARVADGSSLADRRRVRVHAALPLRALAALSPDPEVTGDVLAARVVDAWQFAAVDPYRAATHNRGVMAGIDLVARAAGQDVAALAAGAHAFAARTGRYTALTRWWLDAEALHGRLEAPLDVGPCRRGTLERAALAMAAGAIGLAANLAELAAPEEALS